MLEKDLMTFEQMMSYLKSIKKYKNGTDFLSRLQKQRFDILRNLESNIKSIEASASAIDYSKEPVQHDFVSDERELALVAARDAYMREYRIKMRNIELREKEYNTILFCIGQLDAVYSEVIDWKYFTDSTCPWEMMYKSRSAFYEVLQDAVAALYQLVRLTQLNGQNGGDSNV